MLRAQMFRSLIPVLMIKERNIRARNITILPIHFVLQDRYVLVTRSWVIPLCSIPIAICYLALSVPRRALTKDKHGKVGKQRRLHSSIFGTGKGIRSMVNTHCMFLKNLKKYEEFNKNPETRRSL